MKEIDPKSKVLDKFFLVFNNRDMEEQYSVKNKEEVKDGNIYFSILNLFLGASLFIFFVCISVEVKETYSRKGMELRNFQGQKLKNSKARLYYSNFVLVNNTAEILENENIFMREDHSYIVRQYLFAERCYPIIISSLLTYVMMLISALTVNNRKLQRLISLINYGIFGMNFHIISGILRSFFNLSSDPIFFVVAIQLFFRLLAIYKIKMNWFSICIVSLVNLIFEWSLFMFIIHYKTHTTMVYYLSVDTLIQVVSVILAYYKELNSKYEFFLLNRLNFDKKYMANFLFNMSMGFFTYFNRNIIFINQYMKNIINNHQFCELKKNNNNFKYFNNSDSEEENYANTTNKNNFNCPNKFLNAHFYSSYSKASLNYNYKITLEKIIHNLTDLNLELPSEIINLFNKENNIFSMEKFYSYMMKLDKFKNFTYLGKLKFDNKQKTNKLIENEENFNFEQFANFEEEKINKQYEILVRIVEHDNQDKYLEFIFNDISNAIQTERIKTISNCRSMYLSKIAHEFKNPISSLIEISTKINEEATYNNNNSLKSISELSDYSFNICKVMNIYLNDFSLFTCLKVPCKSQCKNFKVCSGCSLQLYCIKCLVCANCEKVSEMAFDYKSILNEHLSTFHSLNKHENKRNTFQLEINSSSNLILTNRNVFNSIIYNLLYYSYKSQDNSNIVIKVRDSSDGYVTIEIDDTGLEISGKFIEDLNEMKLNFEDHSDLLSNNGNFIKYFKLYISFCLVRKIGSFLKIKSGINGSRFLFKVKSFQEVQNGLENFFIIPNEIYEKNTKTPDNKINIRNIQKYIPFNIKVYTPKRKAKSLSSTLNDISDTKTKMNDAPLFFHYNNLIEDEESEDTNDTNYIKALSPFNSSKATNQIDNTLRILIIDDESLVRRTIIRYINKLNEFNSLKCKIEYTEAENCFQAIDIIYKNFSQKILFNYIIVDEFMPFMKGSTLIKLMKDLSKENEFYKICFVSYTSFDTSEKKQFIMNQGADYILNKPIQYDEFNQFMTDLIKKNKH